jgi:hypothetical protein
MRSILVLGIPRGGTTWVGRALAATPGTVYVHEPDGVHEPFAFRARTRDGVTQYPAPAIGDELPEHLRLWRGAFAGGRPAGSIRDRVARRAYARVPAEVRRDARETGKYPLRLRTAIAAAVPLTSRPDVDNVVVKSVNGALAADWLADRFDPAVVIVTRDLRNVVASWRAIGLGAPGWDVYDDIRAHAARRWQVDIPPKGGPVERTATLCSVLLLALHDSARRHPDWKWIVHEETTRDPQGTLEQAATELGLTWSTAAREFVAASNQPGTGYATNRVAEDLPDQWKTRLDADDVNTIERVIDRFPSELWDVARRD